MNTTAIILRANKYRTIEAIRRSRLPEGGKSIGQVFRSREYRQMERAGRLATIYEEVIAARRARQRARRQ